MNPRRWSLLRNPLSMAGVAIGLVSLANIFLFTLIDIIAKTTNPYVGILAYRAAPAFLTLALILVVGGMWRARHRRVAEVPGEVSPYPCFDLNNRQCLITLLGFLALLAPADIGDLTQVAYTDCHTGAQSVSCAAVQYIVRGRKIHKFGSNLMSQLPTYR
jgi:hypothetical protein